MSWVDLYPWRNLSNCIYSTWHFQCILLYSLRMMPLQNKWNQIAILRWIWICVFPREIIIHILTYYLFLVAESPKGARSLLVPTFTFLVPSFFLAAVSFLGVKIRKLKVDFMTGGTWRRVRQWTLIMNIYDFFSST